MPEQEPFMMSIEEVIAIKQRPGCAVLGRAQQGILRRGDAITILGQGKEPVTTQVDGFGGFIHDQDSWVVLPGYNCALILHDVESTQIAIGMIVMAFSAEK